MSISSLGAVNYQTVGTLGASSNAGSATGGAVSASDSASSTSTTSATSANGSALSAAIAQALSQINPNLDLTSLLSSSGQQSSSNFASTLLNSLPGLAEQNANSANNVGGTNIAQLLSLSSGQTSNSPAPVQLNKSSPTFNLQSSIQQLITNLGSGANSIGSMFGDSSNASDTSNAALQSSFNSLVSGSGGNPTQANLQSFLKLVAANVESSVSIGSLFSTSA
ncbi:hypothetical protein ACO0K7_07990 [Undibacterium sp. Ji67W]|uniref:hypothetical protein n=1 Tax=Undibacterium sp. Ji67W TaxID=3413042 RepID=UPI003BF387B7